MTAACCTTCNCAGPAFDTTKVDGVYVPTDAEHPDPLYLWQLIKDYSGRTLLPAALG